MASTLFGYCVYQTDIGNMTSGYPHLAAVHQPVVTLVLSEGLHAGHIGTGIGFSYGEAAYMLSADQFGDVFLLLFLGAILVDSHGRPPAVAAYAQPPGGMNFGDFVKGQNRFHPAHAISAVFLGDAPP